MGSIVFLACIGCRRESRLTPEAIYEQIEKEFLSGELSKARIASEAAYRRFESSRPDRAAIFRIELAKVLIYQGKSGDALTLLEQPLPPRSKIDSQVRQQIFLSIAQTGVGHLDQAEQTLLQAQEHCPAGVLHAELANAQGIIAINGGKLDDAEKAFQASLAGARLSGDRFLQIGALTNLGVVALREEHFEDALTDFGEASRLARLIGAKLLLEKATGNAGWAYYKLGDFQRSLTSTQEAERQAADLGAPGDQVHWLNNSGMSEYRLGNLEAARSFYERTLVLAQSIPNQEEILDAHVNLGFLLLRSGDLNAAETHARQAMSVAALRPNDTERLEPELLSALLSNARGDKRRAATALLDLEPRAVAFPSLRWATESNLAHIYADTGQHRNADIWFRRAIDTFHRQRSSLTSVESTLPFLENGADLYDGYMEFLIRDHRTEEALNVADESRAESLLDGIKSSPVKQAIQSSQRINAQTIATRMQATVLVYSLQPKVSYLWAITPARQQFYELPGSETILPLVQQQTKSIMASKDLLSQRESSAQTLYDQLVKPAESLIKNDGRVFIVGGEGLDGLNFETLIKSGGEPHYWIEDVTITNAKSLRLLSVRSNIETKRVNRSILLIGDPIYRKEEYGALANASSEVANIAGHFDASQRTVYTGGEASPAVYQIAQPSKFSYIHFVAHATANMTSPLDSAVVLSRDRSDATVYKLYARDILKQNLHADLVTLSACYGSGLRDYSGEGLVGLAWAFLRAGSHQVIGAMWEVSDASTPQLMDQLYARLVQGIPPDAALRSAKLSMIHAGGVFRKPLYWAPFQLYAGA
ncbi:MAG: Tetratricopeptide 1 repeat-containing protein [Acidobacteriaceae bacterium]|nr:Tetratricopeptide 1 repeat-containing protein [Acidobacteriaceae bacterium]